MKIENDLQTSLTSPPNGQVYVRCCPLNKWVSKVRVCPVTNWNSNNIETCFLNLLEILECDPCAPMLLQSLQGFDFAKRLAEGPLINNIRTGSIIKRGRDEAIPGVRKSYRFGSGFTLQERAILPSSLLGLFVYPTQKRLLWPQYFY